MAIINKYAEQIKALEEAEGAMDCTQVQSGFSSEPPAEGVALFRFTSYIETGAHKVKSGQGKGNVQPWADFVFELVHPRHVKGEGDKARPGMFRLSNYNISMNEKARYKKLFDQMADGFAGNPKTFPAMLGGAFFGHIEHNKVGDKTYVNLVDIGFPEYEADPNLEPGVMKPIAVPDAFAEETTCFLFDAPEMPDALLKAMWDDLEITGEKSDGSKKKNWIQEKIRAAVNFEGSQLQAVTGASAVAEIAEAVVQTEPKAAVADELPLVEITPQAEAVVETPAESPVVNDLGEIPGL